MTLPRLLRGGRPQDPAHGTSAGTDEVPGTDGGPPTNAAPATDTALAEDAVRGGDAVGGAESGDGPCVAGVSAGDPAGTEPPGDGRPGGKRPAGRARRVVLGGLAALLVLGGCGFLHGAHRLESAESARNRALTDAAATDRVAGEVGNALARVFSYTPDGTAAAERSARDVLGGRAARQYQDLFAQVRGDLAEQRVTLSTRAVRTGVIELDGDRARLLVFLDQTSHRGDGEATTAAAQLTVTARLEDDRWRIVHLEAR
ncbi:nuclear transport factor 2 family protein [Streptomyces griseoflavus]|uniref:nuclear transport factor 2 family protein n=1 Tax=Streptomyces griseoflavus TaxID=35619 RepID=UPI003D72B8FF